MSTHDHPHRGWGIPLPSFRRRSAAHAATAARADTARAYALGSLRLFMGAVFLWAFLDKTFGFGYSTASGKGWIDGGSPTEGFLSGVAAGPMESTFHSWAGDAWADWLFMAGLLGVGLALVAGVGLRLAAAAGTAMMILMWMAEWPPAKHLSDGSLSLSTNPVVDYHVIYAVALIALAATCSGDALGAGGRWAGLSFVRRHRWLR
ncbi:DoxX family membrane protein [Streptomyces sp. NRRL B-1347]|uniref:DoxX family membrane protein n=1 Tax=Streptomyces sp. NRRL B-1347 TaxID=1476877 RepID=UPI0004C4F441|nr:DoxX family membrane protein [Streptomyces sp. NRRL B-1347]